MNKTKIEYLTHTWNPIAMRCSKVSAGCDNCWHLRMCKRHAGNGKLSPDVRAAKGGGPPILLASELEAPLRQRKPARIGVQFMGDLFHEDVPFEFIDKVFAVMALCPQHTFQVLTKRSCRMRDYSSGRPTALDHRNAAVFARLFELAEEYNRVPDEAAWREAYERGWSKLRWPPPNVWLGTSVENQAAVHRIEHLVRCPAAVRFLSLEPLLGEVDLSEHLEEAGYESGGRQGWVTTGDGINWVIVGGESGPGARPCKPDWVRSIRDQCKAAGVPFWFKGWGEWAPEDALTSAITPKSGTGFHPHHMFPSGWVFRVGKTKAGDLLDNKRHHEWPKGGDAQ